MPEHTLSIKRNSGRVAEEDSNEVTMAELVGATVDVLWEPGSPWYRGRVTNVKKEKGKVHHRISYDDGDLFWCNLEVMKWKLVRPPASPASAHRASPSVAKRRAKSPAQSPSKSLSKSPSKSRAALPAKPLPLPSVDMITDVRLAGGYGHLVRGDGSLFGRLISFYTDREHGSEHNRVPHEWRDHVPLTGLYACSSFVYCVAGVAFLAMLSLRPQAQVYSAEWLEGWMWIWQGLVSYKVVACSSIPTLALSCDPSARSLAPAVARPPTLTHPLMLALPV